MNMLDHEDQCKQCSHALMPHMVSLQGGLTMPCNVALLDAVGTASPATCITSGHHSGCSARLLDWLQQGAKPSFHLCKSS